MADSISSIGISSVRIPFIFLGDLISISACDRTLTLNGVERASARATLRGNVRDRCSEMQAWRLCFCRCAHSVAFGGCWGFPPRRTTSPPGRSPPRPASVARGRSGCIASRGWSWPSCPVGCRARWDTPSAPASAAPCLPVRAVQ